MSYMSIITTTSTVTQHLPQMSRPVAPTPTPMVRPTPTVQPSPTVFVSAPIAPSGYPMMIPPPPMESIVPAT